MEITIKWNESKYPSFNLCLASKPGNEPFLELKGCRIVVGKDGEFVAPPSTKNATTEKYWNHAYLSKDFASVVLEKAKECQPIKTESKKQSDSFTDLESDIPFAPFGKSGADVSWRAM